MMNACQRFTVSHRFHIGFTEVSLLAKSLSVASIVGEHMRTLNILNQQLQGLQFECCSALCAYKYVGILLPNVEWDFCWVHKAGRVQPHPKRCFDSNPRNPRNNDCCLCSNTGATHPFSAANASERKSCPTASIAASRGMAPDCGFATRISKVREL